MPVTSATSDPEALTATIVADFPVGVDRLWKAFTDPRQLDRFWGPPGWPATFGSFDFRPGGIAAYAMTSPRGEVSKAQWEFTRITEPTGFEVIDSFRDDDGGPAEMPSARIEFAFEQTPSGARLVSTSHFESVEALEQLLAMGMVEGMTLGLNQLDTVLRDLREYAQGRGTNVEVLDDQHVRITRVIEGPRSLVWKAHHDPELMKQWLLGPDGWSMPVCEVATAAGQSYRYEWEPAPGTEGERFGFEGEALLVEPETRAVTTERMIGMEGPSVVNDLSFYEEDGATLLTLLLEYPDAETRDMILATGMADGMETSYARLESLVSV